jgi:2-keto-3-deoxy-L-rhamnonate aldolase RhmA
MKHQPATPYLIDHGRPTPVIESEEIVEALTALAPTIGIDRAVAVAPDLARALGYDIDDALERLDHPVSS